MRNLFFILLSILFMTMSCSKEEDKLSKNHSNNNELEEFLSNGTDPVEAKILEFIHRMDLVRENPEYEGSENWNYSRDSTLWYIEAALNLDNSHPDIVSEYFWKDSTISSISQNSSGFYNIVEIQTAYDAIISNFDIQFGDIEAEHKCLQYVDVVDMGLDNGSLNLKTYPTWGKGLTILPDGDWYISGNNGTSSGLYSHQNAMAKMRQDAQADFINNHPYNFYITDEYLEEQSDKKEPYNGYHFPGFLSGYWFYAEKEYSPHYPFQTTLTAAQIAFYESNLSILTGLRQNSLNKTAFDWEFKFNSFTGYDVGKYEIHWYSVNISFGNLHPRTSNPINYVQ